MSALRAATGLARLCQQHGKAEQAHRCLSSVYSKFTEGFETVDLKIARALMDELRSPSGDSYVPGQQRRRSYLPQL